MMNRFFIRLSAWLTVGIIYLSLTTSGTLAETRTLAKDTKLHPQGWTVGDFIDFKKNTIAVFNDSGEVVSGTLVNNTFLIPHGWNRVINDYYYITAYADTGPYLHRYHYPFIDRKYNIAIPGYGHLLYKGSTTVTFSEKGDVISGTLANEATIRLIEGKYGFITFKENTLLSFFGSGAISSGTLDADTALRPVGWQKLPSENDSAGFITFSKGKIITLNEAGEVTSGILKGSAKLLTEDGTLKVFPAGSLIVFDELGIASVANK
ncbi:MAG TPA: hypothetical protein VGL27_06380 [Negativicutes bacterium]